MDLKPCPFCNGEARDWGSEERGYGVECRDCNADVSTSRTHEQAIAAWNCRADRDAELVDTASDIDKARREGWAQGMKDTLANIQAAGKMADRASIIEECAKVADGLAGQNKGHALLMAERIAFAIRALKEKPQ